MEVNGIVIANEAPKFWQQKIFSQNRKIVSVYFVNTTSNLKQVNMSTVWTEMFLVCIFCLLVVSPSLPHIMCLIKIVIKGVLL